MAASSVYVTKGYCANSQWTRLSWPQPLNLPITGKGSLAMWMHPHWQVYRNTYSNQFHPLSVFGLGGTDVWALFCEETAGNVELQFYHKGGGVAKTIRDVVTWNDETWAHIVATWDMTGGAGNGIMHLYVDAAEVSAPGITDATPVGADGTKIFTGRMEDDTVAETQNGMIASIAVWGGVLTQTEITALLGYSDLNPQYHRPVDGDCADGDLTFLVTFDETPSDGTKPHDAMVHANADGTCTVESAGAGRHEGVVQVASGEPGIAFDAFLGLGDYTLENPDDRRCPPANMAACSEVAGTQDYWFGDIDFGTAETTDLWRPNRMWHSYSTDQTRMFEIALRLPDINVADRYWLSYPYKWAVGPQGIFDDAGVEAVAAQFAKGYSDMKAVGIVRIGEVQYRGGVVQANMGFGYSDSAKECDYINFTPKTGISGAHTVTFFRYRVTAAYPQRYMDDDRVVFVSAGGDATTWMRKNMRTEMWPDAAVETAATFSGTEGAWSNGNEVPIGPTAGYSGVYQGDDGTLYGPSNSREDEVWPYDLWTMFWKSTDYGASWSAVINPFVAQTIAEPYGARGGLQELGAAYAEQQWMWFPCIRQAFKTPDGEWAIIVGSRFTGDDGMEQAVHITSEGGDVTRANRAYWIGPPFMTGEGSPILWNNVDRMAIWTQNRFASTLSQRRLIGVERYKTRGPSQWDDAADRCLVAKFLDPYARHAYYNLSAEIAWPMIAGVGHTNNIVPMGDVDMYFECLSSPATTLNCGFTRSLTTWTKFADPWGYDKTGWGASWRDPSDRYVYWPRFNGTDDHTYARFRKDGESRKSLGVGETSGWEMLCPKRKPTIGWSSMKANLNVKDGTLQVGLRDGTTEEWLSGYEPSDMDALPSDNTNAEITWGGNRLFDIATVPDSIIVQVNMTRPAAGDDSPELYSIDFYELDVPVVSNVKIEGYAQPVAITDSTPTVTWNYAQADGLPQVSYHIALSSTRELMDAGTYDIWDSGEIAGAGTGIELSNCNLAQNTMYHIIVRAKASSGRWSV